MSLRKIYLALLYAALTILIALNVIALFAGTFQAAIALSFQAALLVSVVFQSKYASSLVKLWSLFLIVSGGTKWLAALIDPTPAHWNPSLLWASVTLAAGVFFIWHAKAVLAVSNRNLTSVRADAPQA
jgi:hypothetical protein